MSKKIHFNSFDLPVVDKSVLPHMVYNLDGNEYYVKTKKAESSDKKIGVGCLKFGDYEWLIKNSWGLVLPANCTQYMSKNYANTYQTMTVLPDELQTADASNVTNMNYMFYQCTKLTTIPQLDASNVTNMYGMFEKCTSLTTIPQLDTSNVTDMKYMFGLCTSLTTIPQLDTSKVTNMCNMFNSCSLLTTIPQLDTSKVTTMWAMFVSCTSLTTIPQLDTSNVTDMPGMFEKCTSLTTIPQLDTSKVTNMNYMFQYCTSLPTKFTWTIDCSSITTIDNISGIFNSSSVKEVTFKNVNASLTSKFTAANLGSQLTKINFV